MRDFTRLKVWEKAFDLAVRLEAALGVRCHPTVEMWLSRRAHRGPYRSSDAVPLNGLSRRANF